MRIAGRGLLAVLCSFALRTHAAAQGLPDLRLDTDLLASSTQYDVKQHAYVWTVPTDAVTDAAQIRLVLWSQVQGVPDTDAGALVRTVRESKPFRIVQ